MKGRVLGPFDVTVTPAGSPITLDGTSRGRMALAKEFHGGLQGTSLGEMLTAMTAVEGSAAYVAIEQVVATLLGRRGSFVLQHTGTMHGPEQHLTITVVPDSGTGELLGLRGTMTIQIVEEKHSYDFEFELPDPVEIPPDPSPPAP